jgi:hypothetical protein
VILRLSINTDFAPFDDGIYSECAAILHAAARRIAEGRLPARPGRHLTLRDRLGNAVGQVEFTEE